MSWAQSAAAGLVAGAVAALWLPWWTSPWHAYHLTTDGLTDLGPERWRGTDVVGPDVTMLAVVGALVVLAVVVAALRGAVATAVAWWVLGAAGTVLATVAVAGFVEWGPSFGAAGTLGAALLVLVAALRVLVPARTGFARLVPAAVLLLAVPVWFGPLGATGPSEAANGPYERLLAPVDSWATESPRGDGLGLTKGPKDLVPDGDAVGVSLEGGLVSFDADGRPFVRVRAEAGAGRVLGIAGDRLVTYHATENQLRITSLAAVDEPTIVRYVDNVRRLSATGQLLMDADGAASRLDVTRVRPGAAAELEKVSAPAGVSRPTWHPETSTITAVGTQPGPGDQLVTGDGSQIVAGGFDPACGTTTRATSSFLPRIADFTPAAGAGWWIAGGRNENVELLHVTADGAVRAVPRTELGTGAKVFADTAGTVFVLASRGVYRLPEPAAALRTPPEPGPDCVSDPEVAGPVKLSDVPSGTYPLDVAGRSADTESGAVRVVAPDGSATVVAAVDRAVGSVVPDGTGGLWWVELPSSTDPLARPMQLVHASASGVVERRDLPGDGPGELHTDLSGGVPLMDRCLRVDDGQPVPALAGLTACQEVMVAPDGRGWALAADGLYAFDPAGTTATKVLAATTGGVPVSVQLARGVPAGEVLLRAPRLGLDSAGRPLVVSGDVLLGMTPAGELTVLAQDDRLRDLNPVSVEGGSVTLSARPTALRFDY